MLSGREPLAFWRKTQGRFGTCVARRRRQSSSARTRLGQKFASRRGRVVSRRLVSSANQREISAT